MLAQVWKCGVYTRVGRRPRDVAGTWRTMASAQVWKCGARVYAWVGIRVILHVKSGR